MPNFENATIITVGLGERSYPIITGPNLLPRIGEIAREAGFASPVAVITDDAVAPLYAGAVSQALESAGFKTAVIPFPNGEPQKNLATLGGIYDRLVEHRMERTSGIVALGGGVVGDVAGYAAASYMRGIPFIQVPTTLLAQVDAAVGGKVGIDHAKGKNLIGAFYQPKAVVVDTDTLKSLPERQIRAGLAEVIKHGVIRDETLFEKVSACIDGLFAVDGELYREIVPWNCRIKADVVGQDEKESGLRAILNFGHTIGHAVESLAGYETYLHGEAIAIGMLAEAMLGHALGVTPPETVERLRALLQKTGYDLAKPAVTADALVDAMYLDKKVSKGRLRFVFPTQIGDVQITPVDDAEVIRDVWEKY